MPVVAGIRSIRTSPSFRSGYGADTQVLDWRKRLVCSRCNGRNVDFVVSRTNVKREARVLDPLTGGLARGVARVQEHGGLTERARLRYERSERDHLTLSRTLPGSWFARHRSP